MYRGIELIRKYIDDKRTRLLMTGEEIAQLVKNLPAM